METYLQYRRIGRTLKSQRDNDAQLLRHLPCLARQNTRIVNGRAIFVVDWDGPEDPTNPRNWPFTKRLRVMIIVCLIGGLISVASSLDGAVLPQAAHNLGVSEVAESFGAIGSFLLGFGPGCMVAGPLSEIFGRNQIYLVALFLFCIFIMASGLAPDIGSQIVFRFLACVVGSAPSVCVGGSISDMFTPLEKTYIFPLFSLFGFGGAALGPILGAWIADSPVLHSWRWAEWVTLILAGVVLLLTFLLLPETYAPVLLSWKARQLRKVSGDDSCYAEHEIERIPLWSRLKTALRRPFVLAVHEPIIILISFYLSLVYVILFTFLSGYDFIFRQTYNISQELTSTIFLGILIGVCLAYLAVPWIYNKSLRAQREAESKGKERFDPEIRLWYAMLGAPVMPVSLFWMAWTSYPSISIWSPILASAFFGYAAEMVFITSYMYLIDAYETYAASALVFSTLSRYCFAAPMVVAAIPFYKNLGHHWTVTILACFSLLLAPIPFVFYKYGHIIRQRSRFAITRKADVETGEVQASAQNDQIRNMPDNEEKPEEPQAESNGIAAFDPNAISISAADDRAINTWKHISSHLIAIKENKHLFPKGHADWCVIGHPRDFVFGEAMWIDTKDKAREAVVKHIRTLLGDPTDAASLSDTNYINQRKIVFLFYAAGQDRSWLKGLNIDLEREFANMEIVDSQLEFPAWHICRRINNGAPGFQLSAEKLYSHLGFLTGEGMHNGGNDAVWELRAYLASLTLSQAQRDHIWHVGHLAPLVRSRDSGVLSWKRTREHTATTSTFGFRWLVNAVGETSALFCVGDIASTSF
ncbi:hypothetical protein H2200_001107 [Cladophialophora chaetospira]|uniref:Major facilitator superfamily (MFS) profile domain-containing protein n=1 Tax=Cladophialophora chaetospira TaxID=386627 RepID=A0AA38XKD0_9EURO|nr:hypothetical protein H2200_001107 [Cladophialophora chaetospira]